MEGGNIERFEQQLSGCITVCSGVQGWFGEKDRVLVSIVAVVSKGQTRLGSDRLLYLFTQCFQFFLIDELPYSFHVIPVGDYAVLERILDLQ